MSLLKGRTSNNPKFALTAEKYAAMLREYLSVPNPTYAQLMEVADVGRPMVKRALTTGWPELGLPPLPHAEQQLIDPIEVHKAMAQLHDQREAIVSNLFSDLKPDSSKPLEAEVVQEANRRSAESAMAARVAMSVAVRSGKAVEKLAAKMLQMVEDEAFELPETITPSHIAMLVKMADGVTSSIHKALQTEKLNAGEPQTIVGFQITKILDGATAEEMRQVAMTGELPPRLLGIMPQLPTQAYEPLVEQPIQAVDVEGEDDDQDTDEQPVVKA